MPRKKRTTCNPRRAQLQFLESPRDGLLHEYGSLPPKADQPICVPVRPLEHNSSTNWVSPQFNPNEELNFQGRRRLRHGSASSAMQNRTRETSHSTVRAPGRKPSVCKFPSLSFTGRVAKGTTIADSLCVRPAIATSIKASINVPGSPPAQEPFCNAVSPPDLRTPEITPQTDRRREHTHGEEQRRTEFREEGGPRDGFDSPLEADTRQILAEDTPEHEYGVRITWRRRKQLMTYLKTRGRLKSSQILVSET